MGLSEKYWLTILLTFCTYVSIVMMGSGIAFILLGYLVNSWFYLGLAAWPLFIMLGVVNIKFLRVVTKMNNLQFSKIMADHV